MPLEAIDDHGTMLGNTCTIYRMDKALYRRGILLNVMRGAKLNLYGLLNLNDDDLRYLSVVNAVYDELYDNNMTVSAILGDPRRCEVFGYSLSEQTEGYAVIINPKECKTYQTVALREWKGMGVELSEIIRDGSLAGENKQITENSFTLSLDGAGYVLIKWKLLPARTERSVVLSCGDVLVIPAEGKRAVKLNFTRDGKPVRTPEGLPSGVSVTAGGNVLKPSIKDKVWSGISWQYLRLDGQAEVRIAYGGEGSLRLKYSFEEDAE